ncbi:MAG: LacI family transcriptional regulator [Anaerolineae bacterium]|nr:LacI family transcriptional regulator [Anaerolineae bacterium]
MRVTLKDVAELAGVSTKTVSRVVNEQGEISEGTRQRVQAAIEQLGYRPNRLARSLTTGKTHAVGIIIPDISEPFFPEVILGAEAVARDRGYSVFLCNANRDPHLELHYVDLLSERQVDGLMIAGSRLEEDALRAVSRGQSAVILTPYTVPNAVLFSIDDFDGGRQVGEYLISSGHRRIGFVEGTWSPSANNRYRGLASALEQRGISAEGLLVGSVFPVSVENGREAALELFERGDEVTALVCYNDLLALGVLQACAEVGKRVPEELSVVGFDDIPEAGRSSPPLTTFHFARYEIGVAMMGKLIDVIEDKFTGDKRIVIPGRLVERASCAAPPTSAR